MGFVSGAPNQCNSNPSGDVGNSLPWETLPLGEYSNFRKYAHPLHVKEGIITEKVFPVFSESFFWTCFGLVMYIWELMGVTEKFAFQM